MPKLIDLSGQRFGRLTVIGRAENRRGRTAWDCKCDCGKHVVVTAHELRSDKTKSCGCLKVDCGKTVNLTHGMSYTRLHRIWDGMKQRCYNKNASRYGIYGKRGIVVCDEWRDSFETFKDWALANGYTDELSIDRIDSNGNYCPENCRWADKVTQANNLRGNHLITYNGETRTMSQWAAEFNLDSRRVWARLKRGWSIERALTEKVKEKNG